MKILAGRLVLTFIVLSWLGGVAPCANAEERRRLEWVYDGDTVQVEGVGKVRLLGIDAPEKESSDRDKPYLRQGLKRKDLRTTATQATAYLIREAKGKVVTLHYEGTRVDRYNRQLAYLILPDGRNLNYELVCAGLAFVYRRFDFSRKDDFLTCEAAARNQRLGVWQ